MPTQLDENKFTIRGRLGDDPDMKITQSGKPVTTLSIATSWSRQVGVDANNKPQYKDETDWHRTVAFGRDAEILKQNCRKGDLVQVSGRISPRSYIEKESGVKRYTIDFVITAIEVITWRKSERTDAGQGRNVDQGNMGGGQAVREEAPPPEFNPDEMPG